MGSLSGVGVPVVSKQSFTFRKHDVRIKKTDSQDDTTSVYTAHNPSLSRPIGSGSWVDSDGNVTYVQENAVGFYLEGRSSSARVASSGSRDLRVPQRTFVMISGSVDFPGPLPSGNQFWVHHAGNRVITGQSINDTVIERASDSGAFDRT